MNAYDYSKAKEIIERYFFDVFCSKMIEDSKKEFNDKVAYELRGQLMKILIMLHPFIPNTCEELFDELF